MNIDRPHYSPVMRSGYPWIVLLFCNIVNANNGNNGGRKCNANNGSRKTRRTHRDRRGERNEASATNGGWQAQESNERHKYREAWSSRSLND